MEFTAENLEHAVAQFYHSDAGTQAQAHKWLTEAQNSPQAWCFVWELLCPNKSAEVQFFAATTLHTKVVKSWPEVPVEQYPTLKKQLLESIVNYSLGPKIVLNRLCIALSAFILHTLPAHWPNAVGELLAMLQPSRLPSIPPERTAWILLQILTVLPEEFQSSHINHTQKTMVRNELHNNIPQVMSLLEEILASNAGSVENEAAYEVCHQAVLCAAAWLQLGVALPDCERLADLLISLTFVVTAPQNPSSALAEAALDALGNMATHLDTHYYPGTLLKLLGKLLPLHSIVLQQQQQRRELIDQDLVNNVYGLFISIAESHSRLMLDMLLTDNEDRHNVLQLIQTVLHCSNCPGTYPIHETTSQLPMGFWYILQDDMLASEPEHARLLLPMLAPVYRTLAEVMLHKSMLPEDEQEWTIEDKEALRCYRQDVADTMMYCYNVLRDGLLELLYNNFQTSLAKCRENAGRPMTGWSRLESCLHALFSVAECSDIQEERFLPLFLTAIQGLPFHSLDPRLVETALTTLGAYAEWINVHPNMLSTVIPLLVMGLGSPDVAPSATMALKDLTRDCQTSMAPFAPLILQTSEEALRSGHLKLHESVRLMYTVGRVLAVLPLDTIMNYLNILLMPYVEELQDLATQETNTSVKNGILLRLKMISMLFATLDVKPRSDAENEEEESESERPAPPPEAASQPSVVQPMFLVLQRILPVLGDVTRKWCGDSHVVQAMCAVLKHALCVLMEDTRPVLPDMLDLLLKSYQLHPNPSALDLTRQFVVFYGREEPQLMRSLLNEVNATTLQLVGTGRPPAELSNHTTVLEAFFNLLAQVIKKSPELFSESGSTTSPPLAAIFNCATETLAVQEAPTVKATASFLVNFITQSREVPALFNVMQWCGEALVCRILVCVGGESSRSALDPMADILLALNKKYCDNLCRWLQQATQEDGFPSPRATKQQVQAFVKAVLRERANKRKLQETVRAFSFLCRGILNAEYGVQSTFCF